MNISFISHHSLLTGDMNSINWPRSQCVQLLKLENSLRWSFFTLILYQCKQHATLNPQFENIDRNMRIHSRLPFVAVYENLTKSVSHVVCLICKFSRGGWRTALLPGHTKWRTNCNRLCSTIKTAHFKEFWILILQYNNSLRAPWKVYAKIEAKSNRESSKSRLIVTQL